MKKLHYFILALAITACQNTEKGKQTNEGMLYGKEFKVDKPVAASELNTALGSDSSKEVTVSGTIAAVCQSEGCWLQLDRGNNEIIQVDVKDHSYKLPKDISGKTAIVHGIAKVEELSVEEQKHLAKDEGKSQEDIDKITEVKKEIVIEADGIIVK